MENKNNIPEEQFDGATFEDGSAVSAGSDPSLGDDDLGILELLQEYLPDYASEKSNAADTNADHTESESPLGNDDFSAAFVTSNEEVYAEETDAAEYDPDVYPDDEDEYGSDEADFSEDGDFIGYDEGVEAEDLSEYEYVSEDDRVEEAEESEHEDSAEPELDATDINLMVAFGLDDELAKTMGADVAAKITEEIDAEAKENEERSLRSVENEFLDQSQAPEVSATLRRNLSHVKVKLFFAVVLTVFLLLYENLKLFGIQFGGALNPAVYPVVYIMVSLQIMLICAAVGYEQLLGGLGEMFTGRFGPSGIAFIGNVAAVVYSVYLAETTVLSNEPVLYNSCAAAMTLFAIICDYANTKRTLLSFNIVSTKRPKYAVRFMTAAEAGIPGGLFEDDDVSEGGVLRIEKTRFVDGFFARTTAVSKSGKMYSTAYVFISVIISVLMGVYVGVSKNDVGISAGGAAFISFFATMPLSLFLSMSYPFYKGVSTAYELDGTILGEVSAEEYSEAGAVCFDDVDAFPSYGVKVQNIKIYNNHRIDRVLYYAASAFKIAGGPLSDVFEVATMEIGCSENVEIEAAAEGYLSANVDDKHIIFGRSEKLREYGINLPDSVTMEDDTLPDELCSMYMLREGKLMAKLIIRYMLDSDFEFLLRDLTDEGMCACIKTFDPNIDDNLVNVRLGGDRYPFRVLRYADTGEIRRVNDRLSSGIVSRGTTKPLLSIISSCSQMLGMRKAGFAVGVVSSVIAAIIMWLLLVSGGFTSLTSVAVVVYQLLWALPVILTARMFLK